MIMENIPFQTTQWNDVEPIKHQGETGYAIWRSKTFANINVHVVEYSPGYQSDHWCEKGHILYCLEGKLRTELQDGRVFELLPGMSYQVADNEIAHKSATETGVKLLIVD